MTTESFKPAWWLPNPHLQTLWPTLCRRSVKKFSCWQERVELNDGDFIDLVWSGPEKAPIVLVLHGLEGSIDSPYAKPMLQAINKEGWRSVLMHFRGCSGTPNRLPRGYHSGETGDVAAIIQHIKNREPNIQLGAIGYSLGANVLLKWLGETKAENPLSAAVAISVPFEIHKTAERVQKGFSKLYQWHLLNSLRQRLKHKYKDQPWPEYFPPLATLKTIHDFDDNITAPMHGFKGAMDYYLKSSSRQFLSSIQVPTLIIHAKDDPFMVEDMVPEPQELSSHVKLELTEQGGHVGFIAGKYPWRPVYWLEKRTPEFLKNHL